MKLSTAARFFNKLPFVDAYSGAQAFKAKVMAFDGATRDSLSVDRRLMSVVPGTTIPARRAVSCGAETFLVGDGTTDYYKDVPLRTKYVLHEVQEKAQVRSFYEALTDTGSRDLWAERLWIKPNKEINESSGVYEGYVMFFAQGEDLRDQSFTNGLFFDGREVNVLALLHGRWHLIRSGYSSAGGFQVVMVDELPEPVMVTVEYTNRVHNPVTDTFTGTTLALAGVNLRWQSDFSYLTRYSAKYLAGDSQLLVVKAGVTPKAGDTLTINGQPRTVVSVVDEDPCWSLHVRHV